MPEIRATVTVQERELIKEYAREKERSMTSLIRYALKRLMDTNPIKRKRK